MESTRPCALWGPERSNTLDIDSQGQSAKDSQAMNLKSFDLNLLTVLAALLEERHVTRAGQRVGLSQPATSNALERLRALFGDPLLVRSGNTMQLTVRAMELSETLGPLLETLSLALDRPGPFEVSEARGAVRIATTNIVALLLFPKLQALLSARAPRVKLEMQAWVDIDGSAMLREGKVDLLIGTFDRLSPQLRRARLFDEDLVCLMRRGHPALTGPELSLEAFLAYPHLRITMNRADPGPVARALANMGLERQVTCEMPDYLASPFILAETDHLCVLGARVAERFKTLLGLETRPPPIPLPISAFSMVWHPRLDAAPLHMWMRDQIAELAGEI